MTGREMRERELQREGRLRTVRTAREVERGQTKQQVSDVELVINKQGWVTLYKKTNGHQKLVGVVQSPNVLINILKTMGVDELRFPILLA